MTERALVIEDDAGVREIVTLVLRAAGFDVVAASNGQDGLAVATTEQFDVVILDIMLPLVDGFEVCRALRRSSGVPIIMLTARTDTADLVRGLELGADDYITKPFEGPELMARLRAVLRRTAPPPEDAPVVVRDLTIEPGAFAASKGDQPLALTVIEFKLLLELARHVGLVMTREKLLERVWGYDYLGDSRLVDMAVKRLREKVEDDPRHPTRIATVRGVGYRMES